MWLRIVGIVIVILLIIGAYAAFTDEDLNRCQYSEYSHETECYDPR